MKYLRNIISIRVDMHSPLAWVHTTAIWHEFWHQVDSNAKWRFCTKAERKRHGFAQVKEPSGFVQVPLCGMDFSIRVDITDIKSEQDFETRYKYLARCMKKACKRVKEDYETESLARCS